MTHAVAKEDAIANTKEIGMIRKRKKIKLEQAVSFTTFRLETLQNQFKDASTRFVWQSQQGGGIHNIHMLDTIRELNSLYTQIAAHLDALRSLNVVI